MFHIGALRGRLLSASALASVLSVATASAGALPGGGHYVAGKGEIGKAGQSLTVKQSSTTGIIDWNSFSIGSKNSVTFNNGSGATLNRVTGGNLSRIAGSLHATGSLYLMNAQGVIVSGTGRVMTGGSFVASTSDSPQDDRLKLTSGKVVNRGTIVAGEGVTLAGRNVSDSGSISAQSANLQAADRLAIAGTITARNADGSGGAIVATAKHIDLTGTANLSASGTHGGTVLIGGDVHGGAIASDNFVSQKVSTAQTTTIAKGAQISADASEGAGGNIVIWSDGHTSFNGAISAKGQTTGGFAEVSSHDLLGFTGSVNLTSAHGATGTLLLDPENVVIENGATTGGPFTGGTFTPTASDSILSVADLEAALATASVKVTTGASGTGTDTGDITVLAPITWSSDHTLTLDAFHSVIIDAPIAITGAGGLTLTTNDGGTGGTYSLGDGAFVDYGATNNGGKLSINGASYKLLYTMAQVQAINSKLTGNYALATPLDASSTTGWIPLGTNGAGTIENSNNGFTGTFDGLGNTISGLKISLASEEYVGLFGYSSGEIRDVGMIGGSVKGGENSGELAGYNNGQIANAFATGTVSSSSQDVGGLVGENGGSITQAFSTGAVTDSGNSYVGGLVGGNLNYINDSYASGAVSGNGSVGGLAGLNNGAITASYATGKVSGTGTGANDIGGFVGYNFGSIDESYESGAVTGSGNVGGFVGDNEGVIGGTTSVAFNSSRNSEGAFGVQNNTMSYDSLTTADMMMASSFAGWSDFGTTPGASGQTWVIVDGDGSLNNALSAPGGTTPMLLSEYSTNIVNAHQLQLMELDPTANYTLATSFSASATNGTDVWGTAGFVPIGGNAAVGEFSGVFDGNGHTISGLTIDGNATNLDAGLFGEIGSGGTVENLKLTSAAISSSDPDSVIGILAGENDGGAVTGVSTSGAVTLETSGSAGGLVGENEGIIRASSSSATVSNTATGGALGGLVGYNISMIEGSSASGKVSGSDNASVGGLVGANVNAEVIDSHASGKVALTAGADGSVGGLIGFDDTGAQVIGSYATGAVSADQGDVGGLIGLASGDTVANSYATGAVSGKDSVAGGLIGSANGGALSGSHASGKVTVTYSSGTANSAGGLIGYDTSYSIDNSYASGAVSADGQNASAGGLVGYATTSAFVTDSHATGAVSVKSENALASYAGGLIGQTNNQVHVDSDYATGKVTGDNLADAGGLIGYNFTDNSVDNDYATGAVTGNIAGGLIGFSDDGNSITDSHASGAVTALLNGNLAFAGGLIGESSGDADLVSLYATGNVNGAGTPASENFAGGLIGHAQNGLALISSYATGSVNSTGAGGLVGYSNMSILDSYATGNVTSTSINGVGGGLVAFNDAGGTISNSYASGNVTANRGITIGGGLVGENDGAINHSFATGSVTALYVGGLVGYNKGTLSYVYATGSVTGTSAEFAGGLVGANQGGDITQAYAVGDVSGTGSGVGGLIGAAAGGGVISAAYWDTQTTGQSTSAGGSGLTTAQLQAGLPKGFSSSDWAIVAGKSFPYLKWQFASGAPEIISGTIVGVDKTGVLVGVQVNGSPVTPIVAMSSGADGYYYELLAPGTISTSGSNVLVYEDSGSNHSDTFVQNAKGSLAGIDLAANVLTVDGTASSETSLLTAMESALGSSSGSNFLYTSAGNFTSGIDLDMNLSASSFSLDHAINIGTGDLAITAKGAIKQAAADAITANALTGKSGGAATFNSATNVIADLGAFTAGTTFQLTDDQSLTVNGAVNAGAHVVDLTTVGSSHNLAIHAKLTGSTINLATTGEATESAAGAIDANLLNVRAVTGIQLTSKKNKITALGTHTTTSGPNKVTL